MNAHRESRARSIGLTVLVIAAAGAAILLPREAKRWGSEKDAAFLRMLRGPIRLELRDAEAFEQFLIGLRVYHYRANLRRSASFRAVYFDTPDWRLDEGGYEYAFEMKLRQGRPDRYNLRFSSADRDAPAAVDVKSELSRERGDAIRRGNWSESLVESTAAEPRRRLAETLSELGIDRSEMSPRLVGRLTRSEFDISDKGRVWFRMAYEVRVFRPFGADTLATDVTVRDVVLRLGPDAEGPERTRRVRTLEEFAQTMHPLSPSELSPRRRAIAALEQARRQSF